MDSGTSVISGTGKNAGRGARRGSVSINEPQQLDNLQPQAPQPISGSSSTTSTTQPTQAASAGRRSSIAAKEKEKEKGAGRVGASTSANTTTTTTTLINKNVSLFAHLPQFDRSAILNSSSASTTSQLLKLSKESSIHPAIIKLALAYAEYQIMGAAERCRQMLLAFQQVFRDYQAPSDQAISRHLEAHLRPLIAFLVQARPLAISMGHAIRHLKLKISTLPPDTTESEARDFMIAVIENYIRNRIDLNDQLIAQHGCSKISPGDVILTFAHSSVVLKTLIRAHCEAKKKFRVIVVDSRPFLEGRKMLKGLVEVGIECSYLHLNSIGHVMKEVTKVILGAHALFSNGALLSRVGTASVALLAKNANKPVIVCCETIKFSDHLQLDSIVFNEVGDPDALVNSAIKNATNSNSGHGRTLANCNWRTINNGNLKLLNVLYDVTPPEFISLVISEVGLIPVTSIPVVLREYNLLGNNSTNLP